MAVTVEDFGKYFEAKRRGTYKCAFCGNETFVPNVTNDPTKVAALHLPGSTDSTQAPHFAHALYSFSCANCGRTDFFHGSHVEKWVAEQAAAVNAANIPQTTPNGSPDA